MSITPRPFDPPQTSRDSLFVVAGHAALWGIWLLGLFYFVPRFEKTFRDFNLKLPSMTEFVLALTRGVVPLALLLVLVCLVVDGAVSLGLPRSRDRSLLRILWAGFMTVLPIVAILITVLALWLPWAKLQEGLSR